MEGGTRGTDGGGGRIEVILLGTGTSGQVPSIVCLTDPDGLGCRCCCSRDPKDRRRNTSALVRIHPPTASSRSAAPAPASALDTAPNPSAITSSTPFNVLIDVGKSFCEAARDHFPKHRVRRLDAVLLTHPHADAINGLDDLRAWTLGDAIQDSIPIYCNQYTHAEISRMYPYMMDSGARTGGGDVPQFTWHIIQDGTSFSLFGIDILPLPVHHGKYFGPAGQGRPYLCTSYLIGKRVYYVSDVSMVPEETLTKLAESLAEEESAGAGEEQQRWPKGGSGGGLEVLIIDTLRLRPHASHFGIAQAIHTARILQPSRTYLVGFTHRVSHDCWTYCCKAISAGKRAANFAAGSSSTHVYPERRTGHLEALPEEVLMERGIVEDYNDFTCSALRLIEAHPPTGHPGAAKPSDPGQHPWVRPGFDGLVIQIDLDTSSVTDTFDGVKSPSHIIS
ncbi:hypothetical protein PCANC_07555 [Puccinia coronata f. sp. avenae]|uniref:Metallo-beta-lactamase domain-containing protein n=1 Tax=Puccinia coronata f. sp. avenae TaxID=200324 RepID=A0A2N5VSK8_9BASI|nr:hypothetical protein PCANC_07555 [Puccinia coronata f. sp. avenae]